MGDRVVEVLIKAKDTTATVIGRFRRRMRAVRRVVRDVTRTVVASTAAIGAMVLGLTKLGERGDKVNAVKRTFAKITGDETAALQGLRAAAQGTINDFDLMAKANQAMTIGAAKSVEEFAEMVRLSRALGRAQGLDATKALEVFTLALARQSAQRADDLGLQLKGIEASKFQAEFMRQAREKVEEYTAATEPGTAATVRFQTAIANLRDQLSTLVAESPEVAKAFDIGTELLTNLADIVQGRNVDLIIEGMKTIGRAMGDALAFGFNKAIQAGIDKGNFFGRWVAGKFGESAEDNLADLRNELGKLGVIAGFARQQIEGRGGGGGGAGGGGGGDPASIAGLTVSVAGGPRVRSFASPFSADALEAFRMRRDRVRMMPAGLAQMAGLNPTPLAGLSDEQRAAIDARNAADTIKKGADEFSGAAQVTVAGFASMAEAAIRGTGDIETSVINMVTNILRSLPGVGGLAGAIIGGVGGIFGALVGKSRDPVPVRMADIDRRAADKLRDSSREPLNITSIVQLPDGSILSIEEVEIALAERQRRNATVRYGRNGRALQSRGSG